MSAPDPSSDDTPPLATPSVLELDRQGGVATITLNRPRAMNALDVDLKEALLDALTEVRHDDAVRAVVLTGSGRMFCVGQDLREHLRLLDAGDPMPLSTVEAHYNPICSSLATMPKPVVCAVNGMAAGAGAAVTFACDFRLAAQSAAFLLAFAGVGLTLDSGASWTLPRLIGSARATAMALLAEPVSAADALEMGLVNGVVPDEQLPAAAAELAGRLAAGPTAAYASIKQSLHSAATSTLDEALALEGRLQNALGVSVDHREGTAAFVAKRRPVFVGH